MSENTNSGFNDFVYPAQKYNRILPDLEDWIECQELYWESIDDLGVELEGLWSSYKKTSSFDAKYLKRNERMFVYDVAIANYATIIKDLISNNFTRSRKAVGKIVELLKAEEEKGGVGLLHFSYNTSADKFIDPYIITGSNLWIFKSIYTYMLLSADLTHFKTITDCVIKYLLPLQVVDPENKDGYGFIQAGYIHTGGDSYGYGIYNNIETQNVLENAVPLVVMEHNADYIDLLRLIALVMDKYQLMPYLRDQLIIRHAMVMQAVLRALNFSPDRIHWPAAIRLTGSERINCSRAIDHYTWLASTFIGLDNEIPYNSINVLKNEFTTEINSIEIKEMRTIKDCVFKDNKTARGLIFFAPDYDDFFVHIADEDKPKLAQMIQPEATSGAIVFLHRFIDESTNDSRKKEAFEFMSTLTDGLILIYDNYSAIFKNRNMGMPYATKNIHDYFNSMPSMAATASFYIALQALKIDFPYFTGVKLPRDFEYALHMPANNNELILSHK